MTDNLEDAPEVILSSQNGKWEIILNSFQPSNNFTYAFYLLRNGNRIEHCWYQKEKHTTFENDGKSGNYQARVFIKPNDLDEATESTRSFYSNSIIQKGQPYDLRHWSHVPLYNHEMAESWGAAAISDGLHHFTQGDFHIDMLVTGIKQNEKPPVVLVCFNGAVTSRLGTSAPFFSGIGISGKTSTPVISVADPTLDISHDINLGWYAGHDGFQNLPLCIAKLLDDFSELTGARLVLFGGSGGGFASLQIINLLKTANASAFVWNPQTAISKYNPASVRCFLQIAFPMASSSGELSELLDSTGVVHNLTSSDYVTAAKRPILYIQNSSDWHTQFHANPFIKIFSNHEKLSEEVMSFGENSVYWEGSWGEGHAPPPEKIIIYALEEIISGKEISSIALELETINRSM